MKKTLVAAALALALPTAVLADDLNPGALQMTGRSSAAFLSETVKAGSTKLSDESRIDADLSALYFISKFLGVGLATSYQKVTPDVGSASSTFLFGPKAGLDYELMRHFSVFADATVGVAQMKVGGTSGSGYGLEIAGGFRLFLNQNVSFDIAGVFQTASADLSGVTMKTTTAGAMLGFSLYLTNTPINADYGRDRNPDPYGGRDYQR
jgi:hypothetical protein